MGEKMSKIVYAYVVSDLCHIGHLIHLENAKALGDKLIVGVLTDESTMIKKPKPIIPFDERIRLIKALKCVDCAIVQDTYSPIKNIKAIKPDILAESTSHSESDLKKTKKVAKKIGCRVVILPYYPNQSSTSIKNKIKQTGKNERRIKK